MTDYDFLAFAGRVLVLSLLSSAVIYGLDAIGVFDHLSGGVSGLIGVALGCLCLVGAFYWMERSEPS